LKHESSPAFGRFLRTNEAPVVYYENLIEGTYTFILRIWTNTNELSQDTVQVHVHGTPQLSAHSSSQMIVSHSGSSFLVPFDKQNLAENLVQIELDIQPNNFNEFLKKQFLRKLEILLKQYEMFKLQNPRVFLINTKVFFNTYTSKSTVILEVIITDSKQVNMNENELDDEIDANFDDQTMAGREIIKSDFIVRELRKRQKYLKFNLINSSLSSVKSMLKTFNLESYNSYLNSFIHTMFTNNTAMGNVKLEEFLNMKVLGISQVTCLAGVYNSSLAKNARFSCSNHGKCDVFSHKCICDRYYMHNVLLHYFSYENDLTDGNNCGKLDSIKKKLFKKLSF
jgi:hypothetical protein